MGGVRRVMDARIDDAMRRYDKRCGEVYNRPYFSFNRKTPVANRKWYSSFVELLDWCASAEVDYKDFITVVVPFKSPRFSAVWLVSGTARARYAETRDEKPVSTTLHTNQTVMDSVRTTMAASFDIFRQSMQLFKDYDYTLIMSGPSLSPEFLATDSRFLRLLQDRRVGGPYCGPVADVLGRIATDQQYRETLRGIRDAELSCA